MAEGGAVSVVQGMTPGGIWIGTAVLNWDTAHQLSNTAPESDKVRERERKQEFIYEIKKEREQAYMRASEHI